MSVQLRFANKDRSFISKYTVTEAKQVFDKPKIYRIFTDVESGKDPTGNVVKHFNIIIAASGTCTLTELQYKYLVTKNQIRRRLTVDNVELLPPSKNVLLLTLRDIQNNVLYLQLDLSTLTNDNAIVDLIETLSRIRKPILPQY